MTEISELAGEVSKLLMSADSGYATFSRDEIEIMTCKMDIIYNHLLDIEQVHVERCEDCARVIKSVGIKLNRHDKVVTA